MSADSEKMIALLTEIRDLLKHGTSTPAPARNSVPYRQTPARPVEGGGVLMRFGLKKGNPITDAEDKDVSWYLRALADNISDPSKARFRDSNIAHFNECRVALGLKPETFGGPARREEPPAPEPDGEIPF